MLVNDMVIFYYVVKLGSFSAAAEKLHVSKSFISKHITQLEKDLKSRLLSRSTRQLSLTEAGEVFYQHCQTLFEHAQEGYEAIANLRRQPSGTLKITAPAAFASYLLGEPLKKFSQDYPDVKLNIVIESRIVDIIQEGYDLALRSAILPDSNLVAQKITDLPNILCASPRYLKNHGMIKHPEELTEHVFAIYSASPKLTQQFNFSRGEQRFKITIDAYFQSNNLDLIMQMVLNDCCIAVLPEFMSASWISKQKLVHCLPKYQLPDGPLYAVYPEREFIPLKVKMFINVLKKYF